jgi:hypothetical protein
VAREKKDVKVLLSTGALRGSNFLKESLDWSVKYSFLIPRLRQLVWWGCFYFEKSFGKLTVSCGK